MILYRGMILDLSNYKIGDTLEITTFASFSSCFEVTTRFIRQNVENKIIFECLFPKNSPLLETKSPGEYEFLTPRCNQYKILNIIKIKEKDVEISLVKLILLNSDVTDYISDPLIEKWASRMSTDQHLYKGFYIDDLTFDSKEADLEKINNYLSKQPKIWSTVKSLNFFKQDDFYSNCDYLYSNVVFHGNSSKIIFDNIKLETTRFGQEFYLLS
jgi:hypothetical protein